MAGTTTEDGRVAAEGAAVGGAAAEAPIARAGIVALVSMVKFIRLLKMQTTEGQKKMKTKATNGSKNRNLKIIGWQVRD